MDIKITILEIWCLRKSTSINLFLNIFKELFHGMTTAYSTNYLFMDFSVVFYFSSLRSKVLELSFCAHILLFVLSSRVFSFLVNFAEWYVQNGIALFSFTFLCLLRRLNNLSCVMALCIPGPRPRCQPSSHLPPALPTFHCLLSTPYPSGAFLSFRDKAASLHPWPPQPLTSLSAHRPLVFMIGS